MRPPSLLVCAAPLLPAAGAQRPYAMNWSTQSYGPDGPWQAVAIEIGSNKQPIASTQAPPTTPSESNTSISPQGSSNTSSAWNIFYWNVQGGSRQAVVGDQVTWGAEGATIPNVSLTAIYDTYQTYPNGRSYPVSVGNLVLGAPRLRDTASGLNMNTLAAWLYTSHHTPSYSYSMHIGSVSPRIPGSLVLAGYDSTRLLGEASSQPVVDSTGILQIVLRDIGLGVAEGGSPFPSFTASHRGGLFLDDEHETGGMVLPRLITIDPTKPYMYLPEATCNAITAFFPVSFHTGLGLYIWDVQSAEYATLTASPAYVSFTFNKDGSPASGQNLTIRIPLQLLTLTLQEPLVQGQNLTYFPCFLSTDTPVLGRAFLQAAFVAVNWVEGLGNGTWMLGQVPGPALFEKGDGANDQNVTPIAVDHRALRGSGEGSWAASWAGNGGISAGAKAGIGVGAGISGLIITGIAGWVLILRHRKQSIGAAPGKEGYGQPFTELSAGSTHGQLLELACKDTGQPREMEAKDHVRRHELE
ncbi:aspartic peptidase domain-containing protein [Aspergillus terricola var. indicus]